MASAATEVKPIKCECPSIDEALSLLRQGNIEAFDVVYQEYYKFVQNICLRILRDPVDAEDAAQDVFIHLLRSIHTFRGESAFSTWLYRVTVNAVLMRVRKKKRDRLASTEPRENETWSSWHTSRQGFASSSFIHMIDFEAALDSLPGGYKIVFILHDVEGYSHQEISGILGRSVAGSKSQLHRAHKHLRKLLGEVSKGPVEAKPSVACVSHVPRRLPELENTGETMNSREIRERIRVGFGDDRTALIQSAPQSWRCGP